MNLVGFIQGFTGAETLTFKVGFSAPFSFTQMYLENSRVDIDEIFF